MRKPILTIFYQFNPWQSSIGGIQTVIRSFLKYAPDEFEVRLVGTGKPGSSLGRWQEAEYAGKTIQFMPLISLASDDARSFIPTTVKYTAALFNRHFASDFIHFHRLEPTFVTLNWSGDKTLFIHNDIQQQMNSTNGKNAILWRYFPAGYFALEKLLIKQFTQVYACNTESLKFYQQRYLEIANRFTYLKNTVDSEIFYPLATEERTERKRYARQQGLSADTRFILFAGRLHPQKDPLLLIRSFAALKTPNVHLLIAGDGELADEVRLEISSLGLSKQVTMLGAIDQQKLADLQRICSVFILTSIYEGLPVVVLEALASGTPVVTTQAGETPKFLSANNGIVCTQRTPEAIAEALEKVLLHPENYPAKSCVHAVQPYIASTVVSRVYQQMLQRWEQQTISLASV